MTTDWKALCAELHAAFNTYAVDEAHHALLERARAALAQPEIAPDGPAVPDGREPASVADQPTDKELLDLMPETMRDEFSYAANACSDATGGQVKPGIFRVCLNHSALEYARAVLNRWGNQ